VTWCTYIYTYISINSTPPFEIASYYAVWKTKSPLFIPPGRHKRNLRNFHSCLSWIQHNALKWHCYLARSFLKQLPTSSVHELAVGCGNSAAFLPAGLNVQMLFRNRCYYHCSYPDIFSKQFVAASVTLPVTAVIGAVTLPVTAVTGAVTNTSCYCGNRSSNTSCYCGNMSSNTSCYCGNRSSDTSCYCCNRSGNEHFLLLR
jgi:hypothetical protein